MLKLGVWLTGKVQLSQLGRVLIAARPYEYVLHFVGLLIAI
jgi:hypothetical protein